MKRQIRTGVFETNSSSVHALCIAKKPVSQKDYPDHIDFCFGEFGWNMNDYDNMQDRADYLYTAIQMFDDCNTMIRHLSEVLGARGISFTFAPYHSKEGGRIDHCECVEGFVRSLMEDDDKLIRFLFGESRIVTGNDQYDALWDYIDKNVDESKYDIYYKYN